MNKQKKGSRRLDVTTHEPGLMPVCIDELKPNTQHSGSSIPVIVSYLPSKINVGSHGDPGMCFLFRL